MKCDNKDKLYKDGLEWDSLKSINSSNFKENQQAKIDELQERIHATEKWIELNKKTIALEYSGYTTEEYVDADDLLNVLKGNKHEN